MAVVNSHIPGCCTGYSRCGTEVEDIAMVDSVIVVVMVTMLQFIGDKSSATLTYFHNYVSKVLLPYLL